jgi:hypothetical protein
MLPR